MAALLASLALAGVVTARAADQTLLNVSYDPTRELYEEFNAAFAKHWKETTGNTVTIEQSHGGSGKQAQAVIDGLKADVVTLALEGDINAIAAKSGLIAAELARPAREQLDALHLDHRLPRPQGQSQGHRRLGRPGQGRRRGDHAQPQDLGRRALELSRGLGLGQHRATAATKPRIIDFIKALYQHVPVLDTGARGSTVTFAQKELGDVLLAWENEAYLVLDEFGADNFDIVYAADLDPRRAAGRGRRQERRSARHGRTGQGLSRLSLLGRGPDASPPGNHYRPSKPELVDGQVAARGLPGDRTDLY